MIKLMSKDGIIKALNNYSARQIKKERSEPKTRNEHPEKFIVKDVLKAFRAIGFSICIVDSASIYSHDTGELKRGETQVGFPDICGCDNNGIGAFIEVKAKGRRSTLKEHQAEFLREKIDRGAFAICADDPIEAVSVYNEWISSGKKKGSSYSEPP